MKDAKPKPLRNAENAVGMSQRIPILLSRTSLEPGIFGIARPVLVLAARHLRTSGNAHLESILAHELCHVRRQDNLAAMMHMAVEAVLLFHPLVWWLGNRLVEERELACDEAVLEMGSERQVYAESILENLRILRRLAAELCFRGYGADLKKRITHIMTKDAMYKLNFSKKLLLSTVAVAGSPYQLHMAAEHTTDQRPLTRNKLRNDSACLRNSFAQTK